MRMLGPEVRAVVVIEAVPLALRRLVARELVPSKKVMVPVGEPMGIPATCTERVMGEPTGGLGVGVVRVMVVEA